jgi:hypothetical protein
MTREDAFFYYSQEVLAIARALPGKPYDELINRSRRLNKAVRIFVDRYEAKKNDHIDNS